MKISLKTLILSLFVAIPALAAGAAAVSDNCSCPGCDCKDACDC